MQPIVLLLQKKFCWHILDDLWFLLTGKGVGGGGRISHPPTTQPISSVWAPTHPKVFLWVSQNKPNVRQLPPLPPTHGWNATSLHVRGTVLAFAHINISGKQPICSVREPFLCSSHCPQWTFTAAPWRRDYNWGLSSPSIPQRFTVERSQATEKDRKWCDPWLVGARLHSRSPTSETAMGTQH